VINRQIAAGIAENRDGRFSGPLGHRYMPPSHGQIGNDEAIADRWLAV
jgi:hypothetical protein